VDTFKNFLQKKHEKAEDLAIEVISREGFIAKI
jgi:hypothetical protein